VRLRRDADTMDALRIPVVKIGGGYLRALLLNGQETVFGCNERELIGRLKLRTRELRLNPQRLDLALDVNAIRRQGA
jgi:hypothetical protein